MQPFFGNKPFQPTDQLYPHVTRAEIDCSEARRTGSASLADTVVEMKAITKHTKEPETIVLLAMRPSCARNGFQASLESHGFKAIATDDAEEGLRVLEESIPSVVVVEPELEHGDVDRLLDTIQRDLGFHHIPILVVTAARNRSSIYRIAKFDIADFVVLPVSVEQFTICVLKLLGDSQSR